MAQITVQGFLLWGLLVLGGLGMAYANHRGSMVARLDKALRSNELALVYMPIMDLSLGKYVGAEALLRWHVAGKESIPPDVFIPLAEQHRKIISVTNRMLHLFELDAHQLPLRDPGFYIALNVSAQDLETPDLADKLRAVMRRAGVSGDSLTVEVTERTLIEGEQAQRSIEALRALGISVALDDFGTGYSGLSYLASLRVDCIKIDRSFVAMVDRSEPQRRLIGHIVDIAQSFGLRVIAEGVERHEQAMCLKALGVRYAQGWLFGRPMPVAQLVAELRGMSPIVARCATP